MINGTEPVGEPALLRPKLRKFCDLPGDYPQITDSSTLTLREWCFGVWSLDLPKIYIKYHSCLIRVQGISYTVVLYSTRTK